jgi:hypothetical protein
MEIRERFDLDRNRLVIDKNGIIERGVVEPDQASGYFVLFLV